MHQFRSLAVWRVPRELSRSAYRATQVRPFSSHRDLADQVRRAAASIPANLAEGYGLGTHPQLIRCARMALASSSELETHLELAVEVGALEPEPGTTLIELTRRASSLIIGYLKALSGRRGGS
jgi:four helix bundle protein